MEFAIFKYPDDATIHFIGCEKTERISKVLLNSQSGFVIRPFEQGEKAILIHDELIKINPNEQFLEGLDFHINDEPSITTSQDDYCVYVQDSIIAIRNEEFKKVVPARIKVSNKTNKSQIEVFEKACKLYPNAFVSLVSVKEAGTWIGVSPEILLTINAKKELQTVALAGTQPSNGKLPSEAVWRQKEIEEQALVSRYIINCFKEIRLREFEEQGPKTVKAGALLHLKTSYKVNLQDVNYDDLGSTLVEMLHPTSAVAGMPKNDVIPFIKQHENFSRELYSGFLGPINYNNESHLFVNLRCAKFTENNVVLYAGAGVTEDSDPQKEWQETEDKCKTIEKILE